MIGADGDRRAPGWSRPQLLWWDFCAELSLVVLRVMYGVKLIGRERVPRTGPIIYATNHQSHLDPMIVGVLIRDRPFAAIARASLFDTWWLAWLMRSLGAVAIERGGGGDRGAMQSALRELAAGRCVFVFPEGARSFDGTLQAFKPGVRLLLKRSDAVVLPVGFDGAFDIWPRSRSKPRLRGKVTAVAGNVITRDEIGDDYEALLARLRREIDALRLEARADVRRRTKGKWPPPGPGDEPARDEMDAVGDGHSP